MCDDFNTVHGGRTQLEPIGQNNNNPPSGPLSKLKATNDPNSINPNQIILNDQPTRPPTTERIKDLKPNQQSPPPVSIREDILYKPVPKDKSNQKNELVLDVNEISRKDGDNRKQNAINSKKPKTIRDLKPQDIKDPGAGVKYALQAVERISSLPLGDPNKPILNAPNELRSAVEGVKLLSDLFGVLEYLGDTIAFFGKDGEVSKLGKAEQAVKKYREDLQAFQSQAKDMEKLAEKKESLEQKLKSQDNRIEEAKENLKSTEKRLDNAPKESQKEGTNRTGKTEKDIENPQTQKGGGSIQYLENLLKLQQSSISLLRLKRISLEQDLKEVNEALENKQKELPKAEAKLRSQVGPYLQALGKVNMKRAKSIELATHYPKVVLGLAKYGYASLDDIERFVEGSLTAARMSKEYGGSAKAFFEGVKKAGFAKLFGSSLGGTVLETATQVVGLGFDGASAFYYGAKAYSDWQSAKTHYNQRQLFGARIGDQAKDSEQKEGILRAFSDKAPDDIRHAAARVYRKNRFQVHGTRWSAASNATRSLSSAAAAVKGFILTMAAGIAGAIAAPITGGASLGIGIGGAAGGKKGAVIGGLSGAAVGGVAVGIVAAVGKLGAAAAAFVGAAAFFATPVGWITLGVVLGTAAAVTAGFLIYKAVRHVRSSMPKNDARRIQQGVQDIKAFLGEVKHNRAIGTYYEVFEVPANSPIIEAIKAQKGITIGTEKNGMYAISLDNLKDAGLVIEDKDNGFRLNLTKLDPHYSSLGWNAATATYLRWNNYKKHQKIETAKSDEERKSITNQVDMKPTKTRVTAMSLKDAEQFSAFARTLLIRRNSTAATDVLYEQLLNDYTALIETKKLQAQNIVQEQKENSIDLDKINIEQEPKGKEEIDEKGKEDVNP